MCIDCAFGRTDLSEYFAHVHICIRVGFPRIEYTFVYSACSRCNVFVVIFSRSPLTHCNTLQHAATRCNTLHHTATHCNTLQHTATHCNTVRIKASTILASILAADAASANAEAGAAREATCEGNRRSRQHTATHFCCQNTHCYRKFSSEKTHCYGVATTSRRLKIIGLFRRI